jgi:hypothetical protein
MFYVGEWPREHIIGILDVFKNDFGKVDEAMFQDVESPYILGIEKIDLDGFA